MKRNNRRVTKHIQCNSSNCVACWKCVSVCPNEVLGKIDFFFHRHAKIVKPDKCTGCMNCVKVCKEQALTPMV